MAAEDQEPYQAPRPATELLDKTKSLMAELHEVIREIVLNIGHTPDADAALDHVQRAVDATERHHAAIRAKLPVS
jgi:hypothetical protein